MRVLSPGFSNSGHGAGMLPVTMPPQSPFACDADVIEIGEAFAARTLPKPRWTHAAHFAAVIWLLHERADLDAIVHMPVLIRAYNEATGVANTDGSGYHQTITFASIRAARAFRRAHDELGLAATCNALLATSLGRSDWLSEYWSRPRLFSVAARRAWMEPDLKPLPF